MGERKVEKKKGRERKGVRETKMGERKGGNNIGKIKDR